MGKWIPESYIDFVLNSIKNADAESLCSQQPTTYFNAAKGDLHLLSTAYVVGDIVRPGTFNGFIYECIVDGTSGAVEPPWGTAQDEVFTDGSAQWKTHENYCLAHTTLAPSDIVIAVDPGVGKTLTVGEKIGVITHNAGIVSHTALISDASQELNLVTTSETTLGGSNEVDAGRTTILFSFTLHINDPI